MRSLKINGSSLGRWFLVEMDKYMSRHNNETQARLPTYSKDEMNRAEIHLEILNHFRGLADKKYDIRGHDIKAVCRSRIDNVKSAMSMAKVIYKDLRDQGVSIWG
jgi:hypothetical protein